MILNHYYDIVVAWNRFYFYSLVYENFILTFLCMLVHLVYTYYISRYRCFLMRGAIDPFMDKYSKLQEALASNLDNWLSNLYFEVRLLPR